MKRIWEGFDLHDKPLPTTAWKAGFSNSSGLLKTLLLSMCLSNPGVGLKSINNAVSSYRLRVRHSVNEV